MSRGGDLKRAKVAGTIVGRRRRKPALGFSASGQSPYPCSRLGSNPAVQSEQRRRNNRVEESILMPHGSRSNFVFFLVLVVASSPFRRFLASGQGRKCLLQARVRGRLLKRKQKRKMERKKESKKERTVKPTSSFPASPFSHSLHRRPKHLPTRREWQHRGSRPVTVVLPTTSRRAQHDGRERRRVEGGVDGR